MSQVLQVLERTSNHQAMMLPASATANDLRGVVQYLRKRPEGVTLGEAVDAIKKQVFEPAKISAYIALGLVAQSGDRLKLDTLGWEMARALEPEARVFRAVLDQTEAYRAVLDWAHQQKHDFLIHPDVARYWCDYYPEALGINTSKMIESNVICFFQLCQAAALGTHIVGKKGQPTRLRLDRDELLTFLTIDPASEIERASEQTLTNLNRPERMRIFKEEGSSDNAHTLEAMRVYISTGSNTELARQAQVALSLADIECRIVERWETASALLPSSDVMRHCDAGIIIVTAEDCRPTSDVECSLKESLRIEIGAAHVLYGDRLILLWDATLTAPEDLRNLSLCTFEEGNLTWDAGVRLAQSVKAFRMAESGQNRQ